MAVLEKILLAIVALFCGVLAWQSLGIKAPARTFPLFLTGITGALAAFALARSVARPMTGTLFAPGRGRFVLAGAAGLVAYAVAMSGSFLAGTLAFLFVGYVFLMPDRSARGIVTAALVAVVMTCFTWLCFAYWLGVNLS